jgi:hypothetical protein
MFFKYNKYNNKIVLFFLLLKFKLYIFYTFIYMFINMLINKSYNIVLLKSNIFILIITNINMNNHQRK